MDDGNPKRGTSLSTDAPSDPAPSCRATELAASPVTPVMDAITSGEDAWATGIREIEKREAVGETSIEK